MPDLVVFSPWLLQRPEAKSPEVRARIGIAKERIQSILDRETVACQKTLEQKIADQGPKAKRVDPHLIGLAIKDMMGLNRLRTHTHPATGQIGWYSNMLTPQFEIDDRLKELAPLYAQVSIGAFGNLIGDALEVAVYRCLDEINRLDARYVYQGFFQLHQPKNNQGRFVKVQPPKTVGSKTTIKEADFIQYGYAEGGVCIECKNYREWLYPHDGMIKELIIKASDLGLVPVLIHRRIHYTTLTNFLEPAGIIAHQSYFQYYPSDHADLAAKVSDKRSLGFTDVRATEDPDDRTRKFFRSMLPAVIPYMADQWRKNEGHLRDYASDKINLAQLYTKIHSPAGGKWKDR